MSASNLIGGRNGHGDDNSDNNLGFEDALQSAGAPASTPSLATSGPSPVFYAAQPAPQAPVTTFDDVVVTTGNVSFTLEFAQDSNDNPTAAFETGIENAAKLLANAMNIGHAVNFNLSIYSSLTGGGAYAGPSAISTDTYTNVKNDLINNAVAGDTNFNALPTGASAYGYGSIDVTSAQQKAFGTFTGSSSALDGSANFDVNIASNAIVGVALHEITHALGRVPSGPPYSINPNIFDLFRFTAPGSIFVDNSNPPITTAAYFSVDGGNTHLADYGENSDPSDFANPTYGTPLSNLTPDDAFNQYYIPGGTIQGLTQVDLTQMDALGFDTFGSAVTCYVRGTRIRAERGETPVELLQVGERVVTASGALRPIVWIGRRRVNVARHPEPLEARPIRVAAHAFGEGLPARDLWISPRHCVVFEGALIPIRHLVNGRSVAQIDVPAVEYWHVELESHDILVAEGLPSESYLDNGNRASFENGGDFIVAHPDFRPKHYTETCLPLVEAGPEIVGAKARLLALQADAVTRDADPHLIADGARIAPIRLAERRIAFVLPAGAEEIALVSRAFIPAQMLAESADGRELGLCVARLQIDGAAVALDGELGAGWRETEYDNGQIARRWTGAAAHLPPGARLIVVDIAGEGYYWRDTADNVVALSGWRDAGRPKVANM